MSLEKIFFLQESAEIRIILKARPSSAQEGERMENRVTTDTLLSVIIADNSIL